MKNHNNVAINQNGNLVNIAVNGPATLTETQVGVTATKETSNNHSIAEIISENNQRLKLTSKYTNDELADQTICTTGNGSYVYDISQNKVVVTFNSFSEVVDVGKNPFYKLTPDCEKMVLRAVPYGIQF